MFTISSAQYKKLTKWREDHEKVCAYKGNVGAIGGNITYQFTPTSIGMILKVRCSCSLRDSIDLSDYEDW